MAASEITPLYSLPNEILAQILTPLTTRTLLPLASLSHRLHAVVLRILHYRLLLTSSLKEYKLLLECFPPASRLIDPPFFCTYLGTPGLSESHEGAGSLYEGCETAACLGRLASVYSCFRPEPDDGQDEEPMMAGDNDAYPRLVKKQINLDEHEQLAQLCTVVNLVKVARNSTRLISTVTVEDGFVRIWKDWLRQQAKKNDTTGNVDDDDDDDDDENKHDNEDPDVVWVDLKRTVGLKLRVTQKKWNRRAVPILMHRDEETAVSYEVEIEEIRIRTARLLMIVERSLAEQHEYPNAVVIGSGHVFPPA